MLGNTLLLFSSECPCWDSETISLAGEDPETLEKLASSGSLLSLGGGYVLTQKGLEVREAVSKDLCVPAAAIKELIVDEAEARYALELNRMVQYMDRAFKTQWGIKETGVNVKYPVAPCLPDDRYFIFQGDHVHAIWPEEPIVQDFKMAFPNCGFEARKLPPPGQASLNQWIEKSKAPQGILLMDFVLRHHHDFDHYRKYPPLPSDVFGFRDVGLIMAHKVREKAEDLLPFIGKVHIFFMEQRRVYAPGWFDMDSEEQEPWKLLTLVTNTEAELRTLTVTLRRWGYDLIEPAHPMFIIGTSIERMRGQKEPKDMFYDWFQEETVRILRPDIPDEE